MRLMFTSSRTKEILDWLKASIQFFEALPEGTSAFSPPPAPPVTVEQSMQVQSQPTVNPSLHAHQQPVQVMPAPMPVVDPPPGLEGDAPSAQMMPTLTRPATLDEAKPVPPLEVPDTLKPPPMRHDWGDGLYRIGVSECKNCHVKATGYESTACP